MAVVSLLFLGVATVCGVLAFGDTGTSSVWIHIGFIVGVVGFVSLTVAWLARWASSTLDDLPGEKSHGSR